jgi:hypothetical protein
MNTKLALGSVFTLILILLLPTTIAIEVDETAEIDKIKMIKETKEGRYPTLLSTIIHAIFDLVEQTMLPGILLLPIAYLLQRVISIGLSLGIFECPHCS